MAGWRTVVDPASYSAKLAIEDHIDAHDCTLDMTRSAPRASFAS